MKSSAKNVNQRKLPKKLQAHMSSSKDQDGTQTTTEGLKSDLLVTQLKKTIEKQEKTINSLYRVIDSFHLIKELLVNDIKEVVMVNNLLLDKESIDCLVKGKSNYNKQTGKLKKKLQYELFEIIKEKIQFEHDDINGLVCKFSFIENKKQWDKKLDLLLHLFRITHDGIEKEELEKTEATIRKLYSGNG